MFKVKLVKLLFWLVIAGQCKHYYYHQMGSQVFTIEWRHCECCTSRLWPTFSRSRILKCEYLENGRAGEKCMTFIEVDFCHRMGPFRIFFCVYLTEIFKVKLFKWLFWHDGIWKHYYWQHIGSQVFAIHWRHCECLHHYLDQHFQGHECLNVNIFKTVRANEKFSSITGIEVDICHRMEPFRVLYSGTLT